VCTNLLHATPAGDSLNPTSHASTPYSPALLCSLHTHSITAWHSAVLADFLFAALFPCAVMHAMQHTGQLVDYCLCVCVHSITWRGVDFNPGRICSSLSALFVALLPGSLRFSGCNVCMLQGRQYISHQHVSKQHCDTLE
jgi:hypothetical protein